MILFMYGANSSWRMGLLSRCLKSPPKRIVALRRQRENEFIISSLLLVTWKC